MGIVTRGAVSADAEQAITVLRESITQICVADHQNDPKTLELWLANNTTQHFARWLANQDTYIVVAEHDDAVSGVGLVVRAAKITHCYVHPETQRLGIGGLLLGALEDQARQWGFRRLALTSSLNARGFYERQEYVSSGEPYPGFGVTVLYPYAKEIAP